MRRTLALPLLLFAIAVSACGGQTDPQSASSPQASFLVEGIFSEFHEFLGGQARLGNPVSPLIYDAQIQKQYFESALLIYDPDAAPSERYRLAPLGLTLDVRDEPLSNPGLPNVLFVEGYIIYEGFVDLYQQLGGQRYVGSPLTGVRYLQDQNRVEQYFENLGFYINLNEQSAGVRLMDYGRIACAQDCGSPDNPSAIIQIDLPYGEPFISAVSGLGDGLIGARIAGPYQSADGTIEVIYENFVLYAHPDPNSLARPRAIASLLADTQDALVTRLDNPNAIFYGIEGDLGHNIPLIFSDYIANHGSFEVFGAPIAEVKSQDDGSSVQCFANACLRYISETFGGRVEPVALGLEYKARYYDQPAPSLARDLDIQIQVWEQRSQISSAEEQTVHASLFAGSQLLEGLRPYLLLTLPNGGETLYQFPPSDVTGHTQVTVPPVLGQNGTLVPYQVCLEGLETGKICVNESYLIWGNP
ncbi:MAG: hypothetical protein O3B43_05710 [Chloroflexi bacterium]|nr:hypothetical protein [Chloroflexota bacterium]